MLAFVGVSGAAVETVVAVVAAVEIWLKWLTELCAPEADLDEGIDVISGSTPPVPPSDSVTKSEGVCEARLETELAS